MITAMSGFFSTFVSLVFIRAVFCWYDLLQTSSQLLNSWGVSSSSVIFFGFSAFLFFKSHPRFSNLPVRWLRATQESSSETKPWWTLWYARGPMAWTSTSLQTAGPFLQCQGNQPQNISEPPPCWLGVPFRVYAVLSSTDILRIHLSDKFQQESPNFYCLFAWFWADFGVSCDVRLGVQMQSPSVFSVHLTVQTETSVSAATKSRCRSSAVTWGFHLPSQECVSYW